MLKSTRNAHVFLTETRKNYILKSRFWKVSKSSNNQITFLGLAADLKRLAIISAKTLIEINYEIKQRRSALKFYLRQYVYLFRLHHATLHEIQPFHLKKLSCSVTYSLTLSLFFEWSHFPRAKDMEFLLKSFVTINQIPQHLKWCCSGYKIVLLK